MKKSEKEKVSAIEAAGVGSKVGTLFKRNLQW